MGILDAADGRHVGQKFQQFTRLEYLTQSTTSIRQFSAGRRHVLALDDSGRILSWDRINEKAYTVYPRDDRDFGGRVEYVCAGWGFSSAYIPSKGIVYWHPVENDGDDVMLDGIYVKVFTISDTAAQKRMIGEKKFDVKVLKHIVLEGWIVFLVGSSTAAIESRLFACRVGGENLDETSSWSPALEIPGYAGESRHLQDVQGSFRSFSVFTATGEVLAGNTEYLNICALNIRTEASTDDAGNSKAPRGEVQSSDDILAARPRDIPILQHHGVIGVAFGDYHCLALHADGTITAHGRDPCGVGALGLGNPPSYARFRGLRQAGQSRDYDLLPVASRRGRKVWFEPEKKEWLEWLDGSWEVRVPEKEACGEHPISTFQESANTQAAFSEWVEQVGRHWEDGPAGAEAPTSSINASSSDALDYDSLGAYFAISVTAAGWHSGSLVMVNEEKAGFIKQKWMVNSAPYWDGRSFPSIRLPDGRKMGEGQEVGWRDGIPSMEELGSQ